VSRKKGHSGLKFNGSGLQCYGKREDAIAEKAFSIRSEGKSPALKGKGKPSLHCRCEGRKGRQKNVKEKKKIVGLFAENDVTALGRQPIEKRKRRKKGDEGSGPC